MDVSVIILTYNQQDTIERTLNSVLTQKTSCQYEIIIGDDASKDGTRAVCERIAAEHFGVVKVLPEHENYGVVKNYDYCLKHYTGKYLMECAGDDWWHNPDKMQLQVDFMEAHLECVVLHGGFREYYPATETYMNKKPLPCLEPQFESLLKCNPVCAPTVCIRKSAMDKIGFSDFVEEGFMVEDYPTWFGLSFEGKICTIEEPLATYTLQIGTIHNCKDYWKRMSFLENFRVMKRYFAQKTEMPEKYYTLIEDTVNLQKAGAAVKYNQRKDALKFFKAVKKKDRKLWTKIIICSIPPLFKKFNAIYNQNY